MHIGNQILLSSRGLVFNRPTVIGSSKIEKVRQALTEGEQALSSAYDLLDRFLSYFGYETDKKRAIDTLYDILQTSIEVNRSLDSGTFEDALTRHISNIKSDCLVLGQQVPLEAMDDFSAVLSRLSNGLISLNVEAINKSGKLSNANISIHLPEVGVVIDAPGRPEFLDQDGEEYSLKAWVEESEMIPESDIDATEIPESETDELEDDPG